MNLSRSKSETREALSCFTFLNPGFLPAAGHESYYRDHRASNAAYEAKGLVATARFALENDSSGTPMDRRCGPSRPIVAFVRYGASRPLRNGNGHERPA